MENLLQSQGITNLGISTGSIIAIGVIAIIMMVAIVILKGYSLWLAARSGHKWWFIILLILNTVGILELVYLTWVAKIWRKK